MDRIINRELKVKTTDEFCGDLINHEPCPQYVVSNFGQTWRCGAFYDDYAGKPTKLFPVEDGKRLLRCKECLKYFKE